MGQRSTARPGAALIIVFVFWLTGAHPAVAVDAKFGFETESGFASVPTFIQIGNPTDAVKDDSRSLPCRCIDNPVIRIHFGAKFLSVQDLGNAMTMGR